MPYHFGSISHERGRFVPAGIHMHRDAQDVCEDCQSPAWGEAYFFWDETGGCHGPWQSLTEVMDAFDAYRASI